MKIRALMAAVAASATLIIPVAAQAGTSAASMTAPVSYGAHSSKSVKGKNNAAGGVDKGVWFGLGGLGIAVVTVVLVTDEKS